MSLTSFLPPPRQRQQPPQPSAFAENDDSDNDVDDMALEMAYKGSSSIAKPAQSGRAPPYGQRKGWTPKSQEDFGDGGAFPEIHVAQYPLGMGKKKGSQGNALAVKLDASGRVQYDAVLGKSSHQIVHAHIDSILTKNLDDRPALPDDATIEATTAATKAALERIAQTKISVAKPVKLAEKAAEATYVRYTPAQQGEAYNSGSSQRIIKMVEMPKDPLEPSKFLTNKKLPHGPPSPPAPVMHSPPRKPTADEAAEWKVPPCVSNWVNPNGFTIPLDKRLAADGRGLQEQSISDKFAKFAEALYIADKKAREGVALRADIRKRVAQKDKEKQEEQLRAIAQKSRMERSGVVPDAEAVSSALSSTANYASSSDDEPAPVSRKQERAPQHSSSGRGNTEDDAAARERDALREQMRRERERDARLAKTKTGRERERDVTEQIALGMPAVNRGATEETLYDTRLLNHGGGFSASGLGDEDGTAIYDKPLFAAHTAAAAHIYRPSKDLDSEIYGDAEVEALIKKSTDKFHADREFSGTDRSAKRDGPVQFTRGETTGPSGVSVARESAESGSDHEDAHKRPGEEDLLSGMNKFLTEAKKGGRSALDKIGARGTLHAGTAGGGVSEGSRDYREKRSISFESQKEPDDDSRAKRSRTRY